MIVSFIAVGIIAGSSGLDIARSSEPIDLLAELGIAVLLFPVGIKLDVNLVRSPEPVSLATGLGQVAFTSGIGFPICLALGMDAVTSLYVAVAPCWPPGRISSSNHFSMRRTGRSNFWIRTRARSGLK